MDVEIHVRNFNIQIIKLRDYSSFVMTALTSVLKVFVIRHKNALFKLINQILLHHNIY